MGGREHIFFEPQTAAETESIAADSGEQDCEANELQAVVSFRGVEGIFRITVAVRIVVADAQRSVCCG